MDFKKKVWVNVSDPNQLPSIPAGQDELARFDEKNMNRIEEGIEGAYELVDSLDAKDVGAVGLGDDIVVGTIKNNTTRGGTRFGIMYGENGVSMAGMGTQKGSNILLLVSGCDYTSEVKQAELGELGYYFPVELDKSTSSYPCSLKVSNLDGKLYFLRSAHGKKHYAKNEIIPMQEYEVIHAGNKSLISPNDIMALSIGGGTPINQSDNLDAYTTPGNFICSASETAMTLTNCPIKLAFTMVVGYAAGKSSYLYQEIRAFNSGVRYYRTCPTATEVWSEWIASYNTSNKPTPAEIGAARVEANSYVGTGEETIPVIFNPMPTMLFITCSNLKCFHIVDCIHGKVTEMTHTTGAGNEFWNCSVSSSEINVGTKYNSVNYSGREYTYIAIY